MCGEEEKRRGYFYTQKEIPPRVRGRERYPWFRERYLGNTPACAGKSPEERAFRVAFGEIPPRVRGRAPDISPEERQAGNTPACAGKSQPSATRQSLKRKYPRVCGEEEIAISIEREIQEIPPRVRGRVEKRG